MSDDWRIGIGYDLHSIVAGRPLVLGGVRIESDFGLGGHTDGDVVLHAVIDALFGAAGLSDIGEHFPDDDRAPVGRDSREMLASAVEEIRSQGWQVRNVDMNILAERPKLSKVKDRIRASLADLLGIPLDRVSVKAKTNEGFGAVGREQAIVCQVGLMLHRGVS